MEEKLYTIGQMAKLCNMTTEQLRHYDKNHILSPVGRGRENDYRYYTEGQIEDILLIKELKKVGLPLKTIAELLAKKDLTQIRETLEGMMHIQRQRLVDAQKSYDSLVDTLLRLNSALNIIQSSSTESIAEEGFSILPIAERPIISTRYRSLSGANDSFVYRRAELQAIVEQENVTISPSTFLVFHDPYKQQFENGGTVEGDLELFANITSSVHNVKNYRLFGGFLAACATHVGHYRYIQQVYERLAGWAESIGYHVSGVSFQELVVGRSITNDETHFVTKVYLPLNVSDI